MEMIPDRTLLRFSLPRRSSLLSRLLFILTGVGLTLLSTASCNRITGVLPQESGTVLFQDNFAQKDGGWPSLIDSGGTTGYLQEAYRIEVAIPYTDRRAIPGLDLADVKISVETYRIGGPTDNYFGVLCRYQDELNYYAFLMSSDGYYAVLKSLAGEVNLIGMDTMLPDERIDTERNSHLLQVLCQGSQLSLWVDGEAMATRQDSDLASGDVGLIAGSTHLAGTDILFDNFSVTLP